MRDIRSYDVFKLADRLALSVCRTTGRFPKEETYGLTSQFRRAALSVPINLVEGSARSSGRDFGHFVDMALGSCEEARYEAHVAAELGYIGEAEFLKLDRSYEDVRKMLNRLRCLIRDAEPETRSARRRAKGDGRPIHTGEEAGG
jgi:four helix bundle protein